jgi:outer membrane receptor protein involved in Fe transport
LAWSGGLRAQDDPFADDPGLGGASEDELGPSSDEAGDAPEDAADAPADEADDAAEEPLAEPDADEPPVEPESEDEASDGVSLGVSAEASASTEGAALSADALVDAPAQKKASARGQRRVVTGSHIRRPKLTVDGAEIIASPLTTTVDGRDYLQLRRQLGGRIAPDTTTALGQGAPGTAPSFSLLAQLRMQPTLVLLNGRRLVSAPFAGPFGSDFVDMNQLPITLIDRVETTRGNSAGLYGDGAVGGVINFITHRDYDGIEVDVGGQVTDKFDQHEEDITLTLGAGSEDTGMNLMVSYFTRQPLGADERSWMGDRLERTESLSSSPASFQDALNYEYPFPDPFCDIAQNAGHSSGQELRIPLFGEPITRDGRNALGLLPTTPIPYADRYLMNFDQARGNGNGMLEAYETSTYCAGDFTSVQDLVLKDERIQTYSTFWHSFTDHTEGFGELGYYRSDNENRVAPSFPVTRVTDSATSVDPLFVPAMHADQPTGSPGFSSNPDDPIDRQVPTDQFLVGRTSGVYAGHNLNERRVDVLRGVLGLQGDFEDVGSGSVLETWDWELAGTYSVSEAVSRVPDVLLNELGDALMSCPATVRDTDAGSATFEMQIPSTIKDRQEMGCYNPFYSSVTNSVALDPLNISTATTSSSRGFITADSETSAEDFGYGIQDGGYICDPAVDPSACPAEFDRNGDGVFELAGTPNTQQVIDRITGEHITQERRTLATIDAIMRGDAVQFDGGGLGFAVGGQYRRETLKIDYDAAYNKQLYAFVYGAPDVPSVDRNVGAGFGELRLRLLDGLVEVQPGARVEHYDDVGTAFNWLGGLAVRPFASMPSPPEALEWLLLRGHVGRGHRAPSLLQMNGTLTQFNSIEFEDELHFIPHQLIGNPDLDFEKYTTFSGGLQWDWVGIHVGADFWMTLVDDVIGGDNLQTLMSDCEDQFSNDSVNCPEVVLLTTGGRILDHAESEFDNLAEVETNGIDGNVSYTLDTKRRNLGSFGTFFIGVRGTFINQYLIKSPRALREFYRPALGRPVANPVDGTRDYSALSAEYDAAGFRNLENFAPPMPKLRLAVPLRWMFEGHTVGATMRYVGEYNDDSEQTIEMYGLSDLSPTSLAVAEGEKIPAWVVFDASYGFAFGDEGWRTKLTLGMINILDEPPPAAQSPLGYDVGVHDPRGRMVYLRATGEF